MEWHVQLHGWRKLWARLCRKPWAWVFSAQVVPGEPETRPDGTTSVPFKAITPMQKRVAS